MMRDVKTWSKEVRWHWREIVRLVGEDGESLRWLREQLDKKIASLRDENKAIEVVEYQPYGDGHLQLTYLYTKKGTRRGPYWYFRYHVDGKQKSLYIGSADLEEAKRRVNEKRKS